ncbi:MAG: CehA/McbA family metallohydrolase [Deltaproteobacteria bacterium]|nr:CehA/McbA family metallohydrolase [Deltaproteobacteria bacterium]
MKVGLSPLAESQVQRPRSLRGGLCALVAGGSAVLAGCGGCEEGPSGRAVIQRISSADQLIGGLEATGRVGDFLIDNGRVRFVVQSAESATGWGLYGGSLIDLDLTPAGDSPRAGDDRLTELFVQCNLRGFDPAQAEIVSDGSDGSPAVLRFTGEDRGIPLLDQVLATGDLDVQLTLDYVLAAESQTLEVVLSVLDLQKLESREITCGPVLLRGDTLGSFLDGRGFVTPSGDVPYIAAAGDAAASYVLSRVGGTLQVTLPLDEVLPLSGDLLSLPAGGRIEERFQLSLGSGDVESALAEWRRVRGDSVARQPATMTFQAPADLAAYVGGTRVDFFDEGRGEGRQAVTSARATRAGLAATAQLPPGRYRAEVVRAGRVVEVQTFELAGAPVTREGASPSAGFLTIRAVRTDRAGQALGPTAAKLTVMSGRGAAPDAAPFLHRYVAPSDEVILPAGDYTLYFSRGPEYELDRHEVTITAGARTPLEAKLAHVVDSSGWVSADLHVHSTKSVDADEALEARVLGAIGEGLEILVSTDHDVVIDYGPVARALGVDALLKTVTGVEISPLYGHINAFPMPVESPVKYWAFEWYRYDAAGLFERLLNPDEIVALARDRGAKVVQINHPRGSKGCFDYIGLDPVTFQSRRPFPAQADAFELLNSKGGGNFDDVLRDMIGMHKHNQRLTATGVSDAHAIGSAIGYARTMIRSASDDPAELDLDALWASLEQGRVLAMSGPFIRFVARRGAASADIGDVLTGPGPLRLEIEVQAPSWMDVDRLRVLENGDTLVDRPIHPEDADPANGVVRLRTAVTATPSADAFYLAIVEGSGENLPVIGARGRTATNPVFVDVDGGGYHFTPP